jgi:hypothetical protein
MFMSILRRSALPALLWCASNAYAAGLPDDCTQLLLGLAPDWNSMRGTLQSFERTHGGNW